VKIGGELLCGMNKEKKRRRPKKKRGAQWGGNGSQHREKKVNVYFSIVEGAGQ